MGGVRITCNFRGKNPVLEGLMTAPDEELVRATLGGDLRAFERLVERHRDVVLRVAARIVGDDDAEDVAQDAFLRAYHRLSRWRGDAPFRTWLLHIAHNSAVDALGPRRNAQMPLDEAAHEVPDAAERTPAAQLELQERLRRLDVKLKALSPQHRTVLVLRDVEGLSYEEIAAVADMPLGSVKARLHRARGEFIDTLRRNTYDWELPG
jgi:RNA polymerase sigma-70 factor (ECF subfamily)